MHVPLEAIRPSKDRIRGGGGVENNKNTWLDVFESLVSAVSRLFSGKVLPVTAYDKDGVRMLLNFASDCPPGRPDVLVMVVSMLNTAPLPVHNVLLQAAVPKVEIFYPLRFVHSYMFYMLLNLPCCLPSPVTGFLCIFFLE